MWVDDASAGVSSTKKPHQSSTRPGTLVVGNMLLGEHFNIFVFFVVCSCSWPSTFSFLRWYHGWVAQGRGGWRWWCGPRHSSVSCHCIFVFFAIILDRFFWLVLVLSSQAVIEPKFS
jgi:hypothetical protein